MYFKKVSQAFPSDFTKIYSSFFSFFGILVVIFKKVVCEQVMYLSMNLQRRLYPHDNHDSGSLKSMSSFNEKTLVTGAGGDT